jgi:hypothetical protein
MKMSKTFGPLVVLLAIVGLIGTAWAKDDDGPTTRPAPRLHGRIVKIDGATITLNVGRPGEEPKPVTVTTDANTKVRIDRQDKTLADLKVGMFAGVLGPEGQPAKAIIAFTKPPGGGHRAGQDAPKPGAGNAAGGDE